MAEWSHQCKGAGRLLLIPAGEMCDRCGMEPEEEVAAVNGRQAGAPPRPLDEWPAFVAFMREQGWDVNDKRLVTPAWAAWMRRALIGHRADGEWVKWADVAPGVAPTAEPERKPVLSLSDVCPRCLRDGWLERKENCTLHTPAGVKVLGPTEQYVSPADAARITWEDRHDTMPNEVWALVAQAVLDAAGVAPCDGGKQG